MSNLGTGNDEPVPLARRPDFRLGRALVRPSLRTVETATGAATAEPRVMQVLLALADAKGGVLSRDDLLQICWSGRIVGDDAINRAVAEARRLAQVTDGGFQIETIPRIGYRLTVDETAGEAAQEKQRPLTTRRRALILGGAAAVTLGAGAFAAVSWRRNARADALVRAGRQLQASGTGDSPFAESARYFRDALGIDPKRADAWGLLSVALTGSATDVPPTQTAAVLKQAQAAANRAFAINDREPNARAAMALLRRGLDDWIVFESELRGVLKDDPNNYFALICLVWFFQGMGRCAESWDLNERALAVEPLSPVCLFRRGMKHWIFGHTAEADRVSERALTLWPNDPNVWNSRLTILAFSGRPAAALRMLEDSGSRPRMGKPAYDVWRAGLTALTTGAAVDREKARETATRAFVQAPGIAANAIMLMSALGDVDAAYEVAEGFLLNRGPQPRGPAVTTPSFYTDAGWRGTQWLFTPATAAMRNDARFTAFCDALGFRDYWRRRGIWPDAFIRGSLRIA